MGLSNSSGIRGVLSRFSFITSWWLRPRLPAGNDVEGCSHISPILPIRIEDDSESVYPGSLSFLLCNGSTEEYSVMSLNGAISTCVSGTV
jgi:hypothetical protein